MMSFTVSCEPSKWHGQVVSGDQMEYDYVSRRPRLPAPRCSRLHHSRRARWSSTLPKATSTGT
jgi:hypothetical protein